MEKSMTIGELAKQSGTSAVTIRYYEKCGLISGVLRSEGGHRLYDSVLIEQLQFIQHAKLAGFSLDDIHQLMIFQNQAHLSSTTVKAFVEQKIQDIDEKMAVLQDIRATLHTLVMTCDGKGRIKDCTILKALKAGPHADHA
ncbi:MAG: heavy metal-responsive transcriptional regulator [Gammaproteobacteria bacterium]|jgi:MerR family copper efflux transcriptional regulator|nr:heavy metal-responsive transcriptional regulator [Gammaproteobacteria bacterium]MBY0543990.1 heavy metal-responsive transcriptional regulator [Gammaproteobacteria bacterium]